MTKQREIDKLEQSRQPQRALMLTSQDDNLPAVSNPALHRYLQEISQYELLSREETEELAIRFQDTGDPDAAYRLVSSNLRLVVKVAMDFQKYWMQNFMDLVQEGNVGLVQATKKFDPYRGVKFSYYAAYWIRAYILKFIMDNWRLVKIGTTQAQRKLFFSLNKEKKLLESQGFKPEVKLLAERLNVKESEVIEMSQRLENWDVSLEAPVRSDSEDEQKSFLPHDGPGVEEVVASQQIRDRLTSILAQLSTRLNDKEQMILNTRLLSDDPKTLQTIADEFNISRERVRQIEANLLKKLRKQLEKEMPDIQDFLDGDGVILAAGPDTSSS
ncbi:sigma-70 family RNA polymerase sigma factor [Desulfobulbus oligotrophicus]|jgi:RNA polymerase sigma-32 factor|uniref:RNA polymerase factor sigma-32 n=1 Tax=Desulfobulbus oligotrophicus TaxID=1909699 RepID=A0A7T5VE28_9BACT|nr:RNA polymerase factor sigma-32 [Desulfobulbus oligotrophicus]MDY0391047.1 RNA polymerase factor sigma-32 [Desulfobulbus oligotrophicus]QQG66225.1 RNA polymerase factor sigma-32 [Desulfobulbus oligotrophicus]